MKWMIPFFSLLSFFSFFLSLKFIDQEFILSISFFQLYVNLSFYLIFDFFSCFFFFSVSVISLCVILYSVKYMEEEVLFKQFFVMLTGFVLSMVILIFSGNLLTAMVGWDGLGFSSLLLIVYYYSPSSLKAGMTTFLCNRIGDSFMIISLCLFFFFFPSFLLESNFFLSFLIMLTAITKSAQIPFSAWLPAAMAAPTPISSLVHSSTLVTAGIYLLFRFNELWKNNENLKLILSILALITLLLASLCALNEWDIKKIIAFSTLSQLGMMMFLLSVNMLNMTFFHLITHAFIKALLFMSAGYLIHSFYNNQDIRKINVFYSPMLFSIFFFSSISLCGFPFLSGFYSKDFVIENVMSNNYSIQELIFILSIFSTLIYTFRLFKFLNENSVSFFNSIYEMKMIIPMLILMILSSSSGSLMSWLFLENLNSSSMFEKSLSLSFILIFSILSWYLPQFKSFFISKIWFILSIYEFFSFSLIFSFKFMMIVEKPGIFSFIHSMVEKLLTDSKLNWSLKMMKMIEFFTILMILISILFNSTVNNSLPLFWL
uniref:NADH-ubiquinone oxidoreductase chain 5 n=1 Tax=Ricinus sp. ADS-2020 TaxID=2794903 RepID=A0A7T1HF01_9NEOP|nr:NADH dehydrogenase subunit 5 [Ricinus sp. ADS-2020]